MNGKVIGEQVEKNISKRLISLKKKKKESSKLECQVSVSVLLPIHFIRRSSFNR